MVKCPRSRRDSTRRKNPRSRTPDSLDRPANLPNPLSNTQDSQDRADSPLNPLDKPHPNTAALRPLLAMEATKIAHQTVVFLLKSSFNY